MTNSIFSQVRAGASFVADNSLWVKIDESSLMLYPEVIEIGPRPDLFHSKDHHILDAKRALGFFVILDTINFGSGYFPHIEKGGGPSGYFHMASSLKAYVEAKGVPTPRELTEIDWRWCAKLFLQDESNRHSVELMKLFNVALNSLGRWMCSSGMDDYDDILLGLSTADEMVRRIAEMEPFQDVSTYFERPIPFYKRAQIMVQDIAIAMPNSAVAKFPDIDQLTIFADNVLPYVLRVDGVICLDPWLESRIEREEPIGAGSTEEVELRGCAVRAVELLHELIIEDGRKLSVRELDFLLWNRGQKLKRESSAKRHRTRTIYY